MAGLSVLTHTHTLPTILMFIFSHRSSSLNDCAEGSRTSNFRVLPIVCSSTDKNGAVFPHAGPPLFVHSSQGQIVFHAQGFPGFYPCIFPLQIYRWVGYILPSRTDSWVLRCHFHSCPGWGTIISFPAWSMYVFPATSFPKDGLSFPHVVSRVH